MTKILPNRRNHRTPRPLGSDAYTVNGYLLESKEATDNSIYYGTFRKFPHHHTDTFDDKRIVFAGLQAICDYLFYEPVTHAEIDESIAFLKGRKVTTNGFVDFEFPEVLWRRVVDECDGHLPLKVEGIAEGSVVYPGEPFIRVTATKEGFGPLVPWFESTLLGVWAASERLTLARHFLSKCYEIIRAHEPLSTTNDECMFFARIMIHDFGDRAAMCPQESEFVARVHNLVWTGTDTFRAAYQNWKNGAPPAFGSSVNALAHRIVQGFKEEGDCYRHMYNVANPGELLSMVGDCYDYWTALKNHLIPLALESKKDGNGKTVVCRPDSGDSCEMVIGTLGEALRAGLMEPFVGRFDGREQTYYVSTTLRFIVANGESFESVKDILNTCLTHGYLPWRCGVFGIGGSLRNHLTRDDMSTKFALCAVGNDKRPVVKFSHEAGKQTLPNTKVVRDKISLTSGITVYLPDELPKLLIDSLVSYYDGSLDSPFGSGFTDTFSTIENRVIKEFEKMPPVAGAPSNAVKAVVSALSKKYRT